MPLDNPNPVLVARGPSSSPAPRTAFPTSAHKALHAPLAAYEVFDLIRDIKDPEHPHTLEELGVVAENSVEMVGEEAARESRGGAGGSKSRCAPRHPHVRVTFTPTVPHCSLAATIGLAIRFRLLEAHPEMKLRVEIREGSHQSGPAIVKQINDKERVAAASENVHLMRIIDDCLRFRGN